MPRDSQSVERTIPPAVLWWKDRVPWVRLKMRTLAYASPRHIAREPNPSTVGGWLPAARYAYQPDEGATDRPGSASVPRHGITGLRADSIAITAGIGAAVAHLRDQLHAGILRTTP
jgi:hypothetical protein